VETFYHPLHRVWNGQDGGESTVMDGDWTTSTRTDRVHRHRRRRQLVSIVRSLTASVTINTEDTEDNRLHLCGLAIEAFLTRDLL